MCLPGQPTWWPLSPPLVTTSISIAERQTNKQINKQNTNDYPTYMYLTLVCRAPYVPSARYMHIWDYMYSCEPLNGPVYEYSYI